jgi:NadR type nicotinamide-nucleotide adenylyltransferase
VKLWREGLVIGKFRPPHKGHGWLIESALAGVKHLVVIVCADDSDTISAECRGSWLREIYPSAEVRVVESTSYDPDDSELWAKLTVMWLGRAPDVVFTSEAYGEPFARALGCDHVLVDPGRERFPVSGSAVLKDPLAHLEFLEPCVRAFFIPRVVIVGAESTGKTTLARALADHYNTVWVPEYGRLFSEGMLPHGYSWHTNDFVHIARAQQSLADQLARKAEEVLICDTDAFATWLWHQLYLGSDAAAVKAIAEQARAALYLLAGDDVDWEDDGTRDRPNQRQWFQNRFRDELAASGRRWVEILGPHAERMAAAVGEIDGLLRKRPRTR